MLDANLIIVIILILLAILDLTVGVANDAINFLNSAIGSNAAPLKTVLWVAAAGVLTGCLLASGMMEIAKSGIFYPQYYTMPQVLIIFVGVMFTDVLLLDAFNTLGLPTSTTVSIVFGLFGAGSSIALIKIYEANVQLSEIFKYINTDNLVKIVVGIVLSILFAFVFGALVQYITRLIFSFNYKAKFRKYGPIWAGVALTALSFFLIIKGLKEASFMTDELSEMINNNQLNLIGIIFIFWTILLFILNQVKKFNSLKFIVLFGTFSLAMAFAANDLVNFIGAPLAGLQAYQIAMALPAEIQTTHNMGELAKDVRAESWMLLIAGAVMVLTLFFSRKAYTVAKTELSLGRQSDGYERFESNLVGRIMVRFVVNLGYFFNDLTTKNYKELTKDRFNVEHLQLEELKTGNKPSFDLLRAAVILMVSSALISLGTSLKLPLSTTYVTFIVAMAAALPDKAWGRESAVYRVSGVTTVIMGWFITGLLAALAAAFITIVIYYGGLIAVFGFTALTLFTMYKTSVSNKKNEEKLNLREKSLEESEFNSTNVLDEILKDTSNLVDEINVTITKGIKSLIDEDYFKSKKSKQDSIELIYQSQKVNSKLLNALKYDKDGVFEYANHFSSTLGAIKNISESTENICTQIYFYINNTHDPLTMEQSDEIDELDTKLEDYLNIVSKILANKEFSLINKLKDEKNSLISKIKKLNKNQMNRFSSSSTKLRRSMLYISILKEVESVTLNSIEMIASFSNLYQVKDFNIEKTETE